MNKKSTTMSELSAEISDSVEFHVKKILQLISPNCHLEKSPPNPNPSFPFNYRPKEIKFQVADNTKEVLIFSISDDNKVSCLENDKLIILDENSHSDDGRKTCQLSVVKIFELNQDDDESTATEPIESPDLQMEVTVDSVSEENQVEANSGCEESQNDEEERGKGGIGDVNRVENQEIEEIVKCNVCGVEFSSVELLNSHSILHSNRFNMCKFCRLLFQTPEDLTLHYKQFKNAVHYLCKQCTTVFSSIVDFVKHSESKHGLELTCRSCPGIKIFPTVELLKKHKETHVLKPVEKNQGGKIVFSLQCVACKRRCKTLRALKHHKCREATLNRVSGGSKSKKANEKISKAAIPKVKKVFVPPPGYIKCDLCPRYFSNERALNVHKIVIHTNFRCKKCGARHSSNEELQAHQENGCTNGGPCKHCGKVYNRGYKLRRHMAKHQHERKYQCKICGCSFFSAISVNVHMKVHQKQYLCDMCSKTFTYKFHLKRHLQAHANGTIRTLKSVEYHCVLCSTWFPAAATLRLHYDIDHTISSFHCVMCCQRFPSYFNVQSHFASTHKEVQPQLCRCCGDVFGDKKVFRAHKKCHEVESYSGIGDSRPYIYRCAVCPKKFVGHKSLLCHQQMHYLEKPYKCMYCEEVVETAEELDVHTDKHDKENEVEVCPICHRFVANVQHHVRSVHSAKSHYCRNCKESFPRKQDLSLHTCTNKNGEPFHCSECNLTFMNFDKLLRHEQKHGSVTRNKSGYARYSCFECKRKFMSRTSLLIHLYHTTKGNCTVWKDFSCSFCDRRFNSKSNLSNHLRTHRSEKPSLKKLFSCDKCNKTFTTKAHQIIHSQTHDSDALICPVCSKSMTTLPSLQMHMRTHTGECPSCSICSKRFVTPKTLREHMLTHGGVKEQIKCCFCDAEFAMQRDYLRHLKTVHPLVDPGVCAKCGVGFITLIQLNEHRVNCRVDQNEEMELATELLEPVVERQEKNLQELNTTSVAEDIDGSSIVEAIVESNAEPSGEVETVSNCIGEAISIEESGSITESVAMCESQPMEGSMAHQTVLVDNNECIVWPCVTSSGVQTFITNGLEVSEVSADIAANAFLCSIDGTVTFEVVS